MSKMSMTPNHALAQSKVAYVLVTSLTIQRSREGERDRTNYDQRMGAIPGLSGQ